MGTRPLFWKKCFFRFFCIKKLEALQKTLLIKKKITFSDKDRELQVVFSEHVHVYSRSSTITSFSSTFFINFFFVESYNELLTCPWFLHITAQHEAVNLDFYDLLIQAQLECFFLACDYGFNVHDFRVSETIHEENGNSEFEVSHTERGSSVLNTCFSHKDICKCEVLCTIPNFERIRSQSES